MNYSLDMQCALARARLHAQIENRVVEAKGAIAQNFAEARRRLGIIVPLMEHQVMNLPDIEIVSAEVHAAWMESKKAQGVTSRKAEDGEELMVPYAQLTEKAKELDRGTVRAVYAAIERTRGVQEVAAPKRQRPNVIDPYEECAQCGKFHYTHADEKHAFIRKPALGVGGRDAA